MMDLLKEICYQYNKLIDKVHDNDKIKPFYRFTCLNDVKIFIINTLNLSEQCGKAAWYLKGLLFAYKDYIKQKFRDKRGTTKFKYYYTVLYHTWHCKGNIPPRKCVQIK